MWLVLITLQENNVVLITVPTNLKYLLKSLDVNDETNGYVNCFINNKFCEWYSDQILEALDEGQKIDGIDIF